MPTLAKEVAKVAQNSKAANTTTKLCWVYPKKAIFEEKFRKTSEIVTANKLAKLSSKKTVTD